NVPQSYKGWHQHTELVHTDGDAPPTWGHSVHEYHPQDDTGRAYYGAETAGGMSGPNIKKLSRPSDELFAEKMQYQHRGYATGPMPNNGMGPKQATPSHERVVKNPSVVQQGFRCQWRDCRTNRLFPSKKTLLVHINDEHRGLFCRWGGCRRDSQ